ncbi:hypothetical protein BJI67_11590 [Acidihalobacter aeolianus]|uniref:Uncharacterized protein n=1 Tax=Acidihalobacter aeolianus TaxID=2792603 RepID=A0A1D8K9J8_9GAMM|nr:hypothetical protein [Acidihalobacter aeolianus]AOV17616.1 hypothetical protein BJI67_11590 [Acidihalobacter aeolianus]
MKAVLRVAWLPVVTMPWAGSAILALLVLPLLLDALLPGYWSKLMLTLSAITALFSWLLVGYALRLVVQPESLLLPDFRRVIATAGVLWGVVLWLLPSALVAFGLGGLAGWWAIGGGGLAIAYMLLVTSGPSLAGYLPLLLIVISNVLPAPVRITLKHAIAHSVWLPSLPLLLAAVILLFYVRRLFSLGDTASPEAPFAPQARFQGSQARAAGTPLARRLRALQAWGAAGNEGRLRRHALRYRSKPTPGRQRKLTSVLLFPYDQPRGWLVSLVWLALAVGPLMLMNFSSAHFSVQHIHARLLNTYVAIMLLTPVNVGFGLAQLRPSLVELYFDLAPHTVRDFNELLVDCFLNTLPGHIVLATLLTAVVTLAIHPQALWHTLLIDVLVLPPTALLVLGLFIVQTANRIANIVIRIVTLLIAAAAYNGAYLALHALGTITGSLVVLGVGWSLGLAVWQASRQMFIDRPLGFESSAG